MIQPAIKSLYSASNLVPFGVYDGLIEDVSTANRDREGGLIPYRRRERKTWIFFGVYSTDLIAGIAIADAGIVANAFTYFYSFKDGTFVQDSALVPFGFGSGFNPGLNSSWKLGKYSIETVGNEMHLNYNGKFKLTANARNTAAGASIVAPSNGDRPFNFTYKNTCLPTKISISYNGREYSTEGTVGAIDFTKGYPPRETIWNWLSFSGVTSGGKSIGLNLVKHFNNDLENILWVDGKKHLLSSADFKMKDPLDKEFWTISTHDGILNCTLQPSGARSENVNVILMKSIFTQAFGKVEGRITIDGVSETFSATGVAEKHHALW